MIWWFSTLECWCNKHILLLLCTCSLISIDRVVPCHDRKFSIVLKWRLFNKINKYFTNLYLNPFLYFKVCHRRMNGTTKAYQPYAWTVRTILTYRRRCCNIKHNRRLLTTSFKIQISSYEKYIYILGLWVIQYLYFKGMPSRDELLMFVGRIWTVSPMSGANLLNVFKNKSQYHK